jgi:glycosyltransferase involved in cell wall biosynthesis
LKAFSLVVRSRPAAELHLVDYGALETERRDLARVLGPGESFRLLPRGTDIPGFLSGLDVFTISSQTGVLPISVLEAMAAGLPLVSARVA